VLKDLVGFWAFVVYDKVKHTLTLVRDQLGVKPLYYWRSADRICASSMISTILDCVDESPDLDYKAMSEYVRYQFTFGDKTFVRQVRKVMPGHLVEFDLASGTMRTRCYENIFASNGSPETVTPELLRELKELMVQCCLESTVSDISFTTFCSGGIDSSLITRITNPEVAYHCNYTDPDCNETFFARRVVEDSETRLMVVNAQDDFDLVSRLRGIIGDFDELTIGSVILPLDDLLAQVKRRFKVILTGTGGDELFGGYVRYQLALGECFQDSYRGLFERMKPISGVRERFEMSHRKGNTSIYRFYEPTVAETFMAEFDRARDGGDDLEAMLNFDRRHFLQGLLNIDDKMGGRHSLESRPSLLHQKLVRRVQNIGRNILPEYSDLKPLLRRIATDFLPQSITHRSDKMGFTTPIGSFVNHSSHLIREQITNSSFRDLYELKGVNFNADTKFSRETFGLLMLDLWLNRFVRGRREGELEVHESDISR
jgi:asparagine synthase (glutamine-hydrolysing)